MHILFLFRLGHSWGHEPNTIKYSERMCKSLPIQKTLFFLPEYIDYVPSRDRERPTKLELALTVPPDSIVTVNMEFDRVFLKWTEHPPDAHHGFYIP